ncbi:MAG: class I SAM-dependent methyltransferase [Parvibaculaceae bacterium]
MKRQRWVSDSLEQKHVEGCRVFADRHQMIEFLAPHILRGTVAEIGVEYGLFSEFLIEKLQPVMFHAYDLFNLHLLSEYGHRRPQDILGMRSHRTFFEDRFSSQIAAGTVELFEGDSSCNLMNQPDHTYDLIYIDGDHTLGGVSKDAGAARVKVKPGGILVFNDYTMWDCTYPGPAWPFGVVQCVNYLCVHHGWRMVAFALQQEMFCDVALVKG